MAIGWAASLSLGVLAMSASACAGARPVTPTQPSQLNAPSAPVSEGRIVKGAIASEALAHNLVGDPGTRAYYVYLPPSYESGGSSYPVIYYLHWFGGGPSTL